MLNNLLNTCKHTCTYSRMNYMYTMYIYMYVIKIILQHNVGSLCIFEYCIQVGEVKEKTGVHIQQHDMSPFSLSPQRCGVWFPSLLPERVSQTALHCTAPGTTLGWRTRRHPADRCTCIYVVQQEVKSSSYTSVIFFQGNYSKEYKSVQP